ncbi:hypothetical protein OS493_036835, partial [Desmophyllum pertusum]
MSEAAPATVNVGSSFKPQRQKWSRRGSSGNSWSSSMNCSKNGLSRDSSTTHQGPVTFLAECLLALMVWMFKARRGGPSG